MGSYDKALTGFVVMLTVIGAVIVMLISNGPREVGSPTNMNKKLLKEISEKDPGDQSRHRQTVKTTALYKGHKDGNGKEMEYRYIGNAQLSTQTAIESSKVLQTANSQQFNQHNKQLDDQREERTRYHDANQRLQKDAHRSLLTEINVKHQGKTEAEMNRHAASMKATRDAMESTRKQISRQEKLGKWGRQEYNSERWRIIQNPNSK